MAWGGKQEIEERSGLREPIEARTRSSRTGGGPALDEGDPKPSADTSLFTRTITCSRCALRAVRPVRGMRSAVTARNEAAQVR
jgi:hypothetical protein